MDLFKKLNNIAGWAVALVALIVYVLTAEPTASWWDCMEFTATSYKLEVGHPPGAPLFMMVMRLFTMLSFGNPEWVGFASNLMSCVASAACILFMFWTITRLARKMYGRDGGADFDPENKTHVWTVLGAGAIGALAFAFTDSFWFSAVESEVYAFSSMFTAAVVWMMLRWEEVADEPGANRWLVLIAYMMGLSIGVHMLNLLTIPALVFIYYFRKTPRVTKKGVVLALLAAGGILGAVYVVIMPATVAIGAAFDRVFVNNLGLPVNSGLAFWALMLLALVGAGVWLTHKRGRVVWNTVLLCVGVILIGYSSYASVVIRASVNPPMNSNRPYNAAGLLSLLNRDQYGSQPILYGPSYSSLPLDNEYKTTHILNEDGRYEEKEVFVGYKYPSQMKMVFPRMHSYSHGADYEAWMGQIETRKVRYEGEVAEVPTLGANLRYFFDYQLDFMFWRYFMWNFVGRQDDIQGRGNIDHGNWLSGVDFIDALYLGPQDNLPEEMARNKGRNKFFFLPFLLGILGLISQLGKDRRGFVIVTWLFVMMGLVLVVYFNITPGAPRERDYIYAGAFYAFSIWIGLGVLWVQEIVARAFKKRESRASAAIATALCAIVPGLLIAQGWDDHDRSGRSIGHDVGYNFLISTLPNSIIMNYGDNDTFPLWYNQEVEDVRPDVRIMNMSYMGGDWYIEQMGYAYNESAAVPFTIPYDVYSNYDLIRVDERLDRPMPAKWVVEFIKSDDPQTKGELVDGTLTDYIPTRKIAIPVDREAVLASGIVKPEDADLIVDTIEFNLPERYIDKTQLMLLDLLANFDWKRPLYFTTTQMMRDIGLGDWLQADGWAFMFVPIRTPWDILDPGRIDTERTYDLLMNEYKYGGSGTPGVYVDYYSMVNIRFVQAQSAFVRLANQLLAEGDATRAVEVIDRGLAEYPPSKIDYDYWSTLGAIEAYYAAGAVERGDVLLEDYANTLQEYIEYYLQFDGAKAAAIEDVWFGKFQELDALVRVAEFHERTAQADAINAYLDLFVTAEE
ncbi:MAG: DUF2723 domain-containing protein [Alistipes sp.]|jgi:hypothetical protein|nr:DUF2723 domain-containing protein [Alistipes sp.]